MAVGRPLTHSRVRQAGSAAPQPPSGASVGRAESSDRDHALSTLVGAVSMARAVDDEALSREILASAASEMKAQLRLDAQSPARVNVTCVTPLGEDVASIS